LLCESWDNDDPLEQQAADLGVANQVRFLEWVSNEELVLLYNAASLFVFPSLYEGFGLPLWKLWPVDAGRRSQQPLDSEIADQAALLTEAMDSKLMADKMSLVLVMNPS
jgi:glycosyltransferase involved in cell wall biosynthesis